MSKEYVWLSTLSDFAPRDKPPQGDRPLPAPREAGPWAPAFGDAGLGRLGEWRPPGPSRFRFRFFFLSFSLLLCGTVEPCD